MIFFFSFPGSYYGLPYGAGKGPYGGEFSWSQVPSLWPGGGVEGLRETGAFGGLKVHGSMFGMGFSKVRLWVPQMRLAVQAPQCYRFQLVGLKPVSLLWLLSEDCTF